MQQVHLLPFTVPEVGRERGVRVALLFSFHKKLSERRPYVLTGYSIENGLGNSVWKAPTPLWSDMHCNSRLVTNLVPFWRVVTRQFTVLLASFPGPVQLFVACSTEKRRKAGRGLGTRLPSSIAIFQRTPGVQHDFRYNMTSGAT